MSISSPLRLANAVFTTMVALAVGLPVAAQSPQWVERTIALPPWPSYGMALAYDQARHESVMFIPATRQTWAYGGVAWTLRVSGQGPSTSYLGNINACYDSVRQRIVLVAGNQSTGLQTWEWNGVSWSLGQTGGVSGRHSFALAYDAARGRTLLFGGSQGSSVGYADLWAWDGISWTQISNGGPTPRYASAMVYDAQRQTVVLFGGEGSIAGQPRRFDDTWEWNGTYWLNHFGIAAPVARYGHAMAYDLQRQRVVLFGGTTGQNQLQDTWEWDGSAWQQAQTAASPQSPSGMVFDAGRGLMVLADYSTPSSTWEYLAGQVPSASYTSFGAGCSGPAGIPQLAAVGGSLPRLGTTLQLQITNLPTSLFSFAFGIVGLDATNWNAQPLPVSLAPLGMPGCEAWIAPAYSEALNNVAGAATWNIVVPMNVFFAGVDLYFQGGVLTPGWNAAGAIVSNAGHARIGVQ